MYEQVYLYKLRLLEYEYMYSTHVHKINSLNFSSRHNPIRKEYEFLTHHHYSEPSSTFPYGCAHFSHGFNAHASARDGSCPQTGRVANARAVEQAPAAAVALVLRAPLGRLRRR